VNKLYRYTLKLCAGYIRLVEILLQLPVLLKVVSFHLLFVLGLEPLCEALAFLPCGFGGAIELLSISHYSSTSQMCQVRDLFRLTSVRIGFR